jgi:pilus assembly protein Flp/PilA
MARFQFGNDLFEFKPAILDRYRDRADNGVMITKFQAFLADESAATAIEYALIAAGLSIVIVAAVNAIGTTLNSTFTTISAQFK